MRSPALASITKSLWPSALVACLLWVLISGACKNKSSTWSGVILIETCIKVHVREDRAQIITKSTPETTLYGYQVSPPSSSANKLGFDLTMPRAPFSFFVKTDTGDLINRQVDPIFKLYDAF